MRWLLTTKTSYLRTCTCSAYLVVLVTSCQLCVVAVEDTVVVVVGVGIPVIARGRVTTAPTVWDCDWGGEWEWEWASTAAAFILRLFLSLSSSVLHSVKTLGSISSSAHSSTTPWFQAFSPWSFELREDF